MAGRPHSARPRSQTVKLRLVEAERRAWDMAAEARGMTLSEYIRTSVNTALTLTAPKRAIAALYDEERIRRGG